MKRVTNRDLNWLIGPHEPPCLSIYMTLDAGWPGGPDDCRRLNGLVEDAARRIAQAHRAGAVNGLLRPMVRSLVRSWPPRARSIALLRSPEVNLAFGLPFEVPELVTVSETFHTKPLLRDAERGRYFVLLLRPGSAELLEGTPGTLAPVEESRMPGALRSALAYGDLSAAGQVTSIAADGQDRAGLRERFRALDAALSAFLDERGTPLVLAGIPEQHAPFRSVSAYPHLLDDGVEDGAHLDDLEALHERTWPIVREHHETIERLAASQFVTASLRGEASDRLVEVATAAAEGRVGLLLHREGAHLAGRVDPHSGMFALAQAAAGPDGSDLIDALCDLTLLRGGDVIEVHPSRMPSASPIAAVFWS